MPIPRMCLSANRVFKKCELCPEYEKKTKLKDGSIIIKICENRIINEDLKEKFREKERLKEELNNIKNKLKGYWKGV